MKQYIKKETRLADFDPCPRFIWNEGLSSLAISVYTLLLGRVYVIYTVKHMAEKLSMSEPPIYAALKMLEEKGLIERKSSGKGNPNHIYVKIKPYKENVSKDLNKFNANTKENNKYDIKESKGTTLSNPNTNKYINKNNIENNYKYRQGDRL